MNLLDEVNKIKQDGYSEANAEAKLCQDIIIKAISQSSLNSKSKCLFYSMNIEKGLALPYKWEILNSEAVVRKNRRLI